MGVLPALLNVAEDPLPCSHEPDLWYADDASSRARACAKCAQCPFWESCRAAGREGREYGIWGGEDEAGRAAAGCAPKGWRPGARRRRMASRELGTGLATRPPKAA
ncbi:WhiB family transcriptional regulator [Streptomyces pathocidini]|uniref:WhiB family transcriptional regulator n=1 Tax=Streptomyces pathocidini TaxID=1650571 RepID=A0ABW7UPC4_9ACTN